jgi:hypothetical protein
MADHDLRQHSAAELLRAGKAAYGNADRQLLRECVRELECRSSRAAAEAEEELRALAKTAPRGGRSSKVAPRADDSIDAIALVKDTDIAYRRGAMIENAKRSIWLSSLTFPHSDLVPLLTAKARSRVSVAIVVAGRKVELRHEVEVQRLTSAGALHVPGVYAFEGARRRRGACAARVGERTRRSSRPLCLVPRPQHGGRDHRVPRRSHYQDDALADSPDEGSGAALTDSPLVHS